uniref:Uncharacterized protein n=1 Tax=Oryza sativa subsp. japonica TaxID=39947 RepID=Q7EY30_ORYSJ|nr:hypothetical protein [Oryza sativa Japonica Group]
MGVAGSGAALGTGEAMQLRGGATSRVAQRGRGKDAAPWEEVMQMLRKQIDWKYRWTFDFDPMVGRKKGDVEAPKLREFLLVGMICIGIYDNNAICDYEVEQREVIG